MKLVFRLRIALAAAATIATGCGSYPLPRTYTLGSPFAATSGSASEARLPVIELKTVSVPDYLDSTDIVRRLGPNEVRASETGQWADRLSVGTTRALIASLSARLPGMVVTSKPSHPPNGQVHVELERFEIDADGRCVLTARWRVTRAGEKAGADDTEGTFIETAPSGTDAAAAVAMTAAIEQLADQIALAVLRSLADRS